MASDDYTLLEGFVPHVVGKRNVIMNKLFVGWPLQTSIQEAAKRSASLLINALGAPSPGVSQFSIFSTGLFKI